MANFQRADDALPVIGVDFGGIGGVDLRQFCMVTVAWVTPRLAKSSTYSGMQRNIKYVVLTVIIFIARDTLRPL